MYARLWRLGLPLLLLCGACASSHANARHRVDMSVLTQDDLVDHQYENVLEAVQTLRSNWLNDRGPDSFASPSHIWVYIDNTKVGDVQSLAAISTRYISSIRKVNGVDAAARPADVRYNRHAGPRSHGGAHTPPYGRPRSPTLHLRSVPTSSSQPAGA